MSKLSRIDTVVVYTVAATVAAGAGEYLFKMGFSSAMLLAGITTFVSHGIIQSCEHLAAESNANNSDSGCGNPNIHSPGNPVLEFTVGLFTLFFLLIGLIWVLWRAFHSPNP